MLRVRVDNHEMKVMPISLAQMVFDGKVDRHNPSKPSDTATEQPLEHAVSGPYFEALTEELLVRLRSMYARAGSREEIDTLRTRVESLCQWHCDPPEMRARILWGAAWLNELTDRFENAVGYYDAFLQTRCHEPHLRLLAYNNRGVLRIRLGRLDGIQDLARSAIPGEPGATTATPATGLPTACFNLLNVIDVALEIDGLTRVVDAELTEYFLQLPEQTRNLWLGAESTPSDGAHAIVSPSTDTASHTSQAETQSLQWSLLGDPNHGVVNRLAARLACEALLLDDLQPIDGTEDEQLSCRLLLWGDRRSSALRGNTQHHEADNGLSSQTPVHHTDAAALLLSNEIPSSLTGRESPAQQAEHIAQEELAEIEGLVATGHFELARSRLQIQRRVLSTLDRRDHCGGLLARVDAELLWIQRAEKELEQLRLQRVCASLVAELEQFCRLASLAPAERQMQDLKGRLDERKADLAPGTETELRGLLDELSLRAERHLERLRRLDVRKRIRESLRQLRTNWPADWTAPVPDTAYAALAQCHLNDPGCQIEDWPRLQEQLDAHQAHHQLRIALAALPGEDLSSAKMEAILAETLSLHPDLWRTIAPLFGLAGNPSCDTTPKTAADLRTALEAAARRLLHSPSSDAEDHSRSNRCELLSRAGSLLDRAFRRLHGTPQRFVRLWDCVQNTLKPVLADATVELIAEIEQVARKCLGQWPAAETGTATRSDPRNPVRRFLESCEKVRCLAMAEHLLDTEPERTKDAREQITWAVRMGLDGRDQVRRATTGMYLAGLSTQDPPRLQRQLLDSIDVWAEGLMDEAVHQVGEREIANRIAEIRAHLLDNANEPARDNIDSPHDGMETSDGLPVTTDRPGT